jgi:hypothetical protein
MYDTDKAMEALEMYNSEELKEAKEAILEALGELEKMNITETPGWYFLLRVRDEMEKRGYPSQEVKEMCSHLEIEFPALGMDYRPHQEFLDEAAFRLGTAIQNLYHAARLEFGKEYAMKVLRQVSIKMR